MVGSGELGQSVMSLLSLFGIFEGISLIVSCYLAKGHLAKRQAFADLADTAGAIVMITLISGSLGTGKTALAVKLLTEHSYYPDNAVVLGVREWQGGGAYYQLKSMQDATANQKMIEEIGGLSGTVYLVDEAKKIWPSRIAGKPVPQFIDSHLAESRSIAQDWIITCLHVP